MANMFDENGNYNKTEWKPGDRITAGKLNKIEESLEAINNNDIERHKEADERLDALEEQNEAVEERFDELEDLVADNKSEVDTAIYEVHSKMNRLEQEMNDGIDTVEAIAHTVDDKIAEADASMKAQVAEAENIVDQGKADMEDMVAEVEGVILFYIDRYKNLVVDDDWSPVLRHIENIAKNGATIIFGVGLYNFKSTVSTSKSLHLQGQGANNTIIKCDTDVIFINFEGASSQYISLGGTGVSGMTLKGESTSIEPLIRFKFVAIGKCYDLVMNGCGGGAINFVSSQDISLLNIYTRHCGNIDNNVASINYLHDSSATTNENCNEIKFLNSTFEHNSGRLIYSDNFMHHNSLTFIGCKFEYNNNTEVVNDEEPILFNGGDRIIFDNCRFTHYPSNGCIKMINVTSSIIQGTVFNDISPINFVRLEDCVNIKVEAYGRKIGEVSKNNKCYYIYDDLHDREQRNHALLELTSEYQMINFDQLYYRNEGATLDNGKVIGVGRKKILFPKITSEAVWGGITILMKLSSTESRQYEVRLRTPNGDVKLPNIHVYTDTSIIRIPIPFEYCRLGGFSLMVLGTNDTAQLTAEKIGYELRYTINETPTVDGLKGDIAWNASPVSGGYIGWICVANGANWRSFGKIE